MTSPEERITMGFLSAMHERYPHVRRLGPSVGPVIWKIGRLPGVKWWPRYTRQMGFSYKGRYFKGRYSHEGGGRLEIVEAVGNQDGSTVTMIKGLDAAMQLDLQADLDQFMKSN